MRKTVIAMGLLVLALQGCSKYERLSFPKAPPELSDCIFVQLTDEYGSSMKVARCPNSTTTTTYQQGKTSASAVVHDAAGTIPTPAPVQQVAPPLAPISVTVDTPPPATVHYRGRSYVLQDDSITVDLQR